MGGARVETGAGDSADLPAVGDLVALRVAGSSTYVEVVAGLLATGSFPVCLDPGLTEPEVEPILKSLQPRLVVDTPAGLLALRARLPEGLAGSLPLGRPIHVTSGTTGRPKAVFSGLLEPADALALVHEESDQWGFTDDDIHLVLSPLHHSAPLRFALHTMLAGGTLVVPGQFDAARVTAAIVAERPTTMFCVPTHLYRLFRHWAGVGVPDLSSFRLVTHAGAPCPAPVKRRLLELFPPGSTWEFYGATEGQFTACRSEDWAVHPGTVGRARVGRRLRADPDGTLWCAVPPYARFSYLGDPARTAAAWRDGADGPEFTVGDHGRLDADGWLWLHGRGTDLIISGGVNVYPLEVEEALRGCPGVDDIAVYGVPDDEWGQRVCAAVVGTASPQELTAYARQHLAPAKRPREYHSCDALPHTPTGKVRRQALR